MEREQDTGKITTADQELHSTCPEIKSTVRLLGPSRPQTPANLCPKWKTAHSFFFIYSKPCSVLCMPWDRGIYTPWEAQFPCLSYCTSTHTLVPVLEAVVVTAVWTGKTEDTWTAPAVEAGPISCWPDEVWTIWNRLAAHTQKANEQCVLSR